MQAYEFYAIPEDGSIKIPDQYSKKITSGVKVILLEQSPINKSSTIRKSDLLLSPSIETNGWKFNREEANER